MALETLRNIVWKLSDNTKLRNTTAETVNFSDNDLFGGVFTKAYILGNRFGNSLILGAFDVTAANSLPNDNQQHILMTLSNGCKIFGRHNGDYLGIGVIFTDSYDSYFWAGNNQYDSEKFREQIIMFFLHNYGETGIKTRVCFLALDSHYPNDCYFLITNFRTDPNDVWFNDLIAGQTVIPYDWVSVQNLTMANAEDLAPYVQPLYQFGSYNGIMLLSYIDNDYLNDGDPVTDGTHYTIKRPSVSELIQMYNDSSYTYKGIYLSNGHCAKIGQKKLGLLSFGYEFNFYDSIDAVTQHLMYSVTITVAGTDGNPYLGFIVDPFREAAKLNIIFLKSEVDLSSGLEKRTVDYNTISMTDAEMSTLYQWLNGSYGFVISSENTEVNQPQGGDETDPIINTPLNRITNPRLGAVSSGFIKLYEVDDTELGDLCDFMWDNSFITNFSRLFTDPRQILVGLMVFPFAQLPADKVSNAPIYAGNLDTGVTGNLLTSEYITRYAGSARISKGNTDFMSFAPYRRIKLSIPYCGEHELDPSAVYGATLKLYYHVSFFSGNCIAEVTRQFDGGEEEPMWFFGGQIGYNIPMSSEDFTRLVSGLISSGVSIGTALCTYGASSAAASGAKTAASQNIMQGNANAALTNNTANTFGSMANGSMSPNVSYGTGGGANSGFLNTQQPHLVIEDSIPAFDGTQSNFIGNTFYKTKKLDDCEGFTKCFEVHLESVPATDDELSEIMDWLTKGVRIHNDGTATPSDTPTVTGNTVITFMKLNSEQNVIGKQWSDETTAEGKLIYDKSITEPSILVESDVIGYNYAYIGLFKRFYYISDITIRKNDLMEVSLKSDPLQSFAEDIRNCYAAVERQKNNGNLYIEDPYKWTQINKDVKIVPFMDGGIPFDFGHVEDTYILTIAGKVSRS